MLFNHGTDTFESEKERNLYYKFFAGFFFNELVPGYEERVKSFYELLFHNNNDEADSFGDFKLLEGMKIPSSVYVTFDFHGYLIDDASDSGELADILIQDHQNNLFIALEAKSLTDWNYKKDIKINSERIEKLTEYADKIYQILLITDNKLLGVKNKANHKKSNWNKLISQQNKLQVPLKIITWEDLFDICLNMNDDSHRKVIQFFQEHIEKKRDDFRTLRDDIFQ